jgi:asparagine synthase (glutamine-hydrolysing)
MRRRDFKKSLIKEIPYILTIRYVPKNVKKPLVFSETNITMEQAVLTTIELLESSLQRYKDREDFGVLISGGVDSTTLLVILREINPSTTIKTYAMGFGQESDELDDAQIVSDHFGTDHNKIIVEDFLKELPTIIYKTRLPKWNLYPYYLFEQCGKSQTRTWLSGEGGDELFGGYTFRYEKFLQHSELTSPLEKTKLYLNTHIRDWVPDQQSLFGEMISFDWDRIYRLFIPFFSNDSDVLYQVFLADYYGKLINEYTIIDNVCAKVNRIKVESPLLSNEMVQFASRIPHNLKYSHREGLGKLVLREIMRRKGIDHKLLIKPKKGFGPDTVEYWRKHGRERAEALLLDSRLAKDGFISKGWIWKHINTADYDVRYVNKFFGLIALEVYYRLFVTGEMSWSQKL